MQMHDSKLEGKTALITGSAKRIGAEIATTLASKGVNIVLHYNSADKNEVAAVCKKITAYNVKAYPIQANLLKTTVASDIFSNLPHKNISVDFLINNAAIFPESSIANISATELNEILQINALSQLQLSQAFAKQTNDGAIINILDSRISTYDMKHAGYQLSKLLLMHITHMCALQFAPQIQVNGIAPGAILPTDGIANDYFMTLNHEIPLQKSGIPKNITDAISFLLTQSFMTGEIIFIDGGQQLTKGLYGRT